MTATNKFEDMLKTLAFEEICVVCYFSYFSEFLDETLGLFTRTDQRHIFHKYHDPDPKVWFRPVLHEPIPAHTKNLRKDSASLLCVANDCKCDEISIENMETNNLFSDPPNEGSEEQTQ